MLLGTLQGRNQAQEQENSCSAAAAACIQSSECLGDSPLGWRVRPAVPPVGLASSVIARADSCWRPGAPPCTCELAPNPPRRLGPRLHPSRLHRRHHPRHPHRRLHPRPPPPNWVVFVEYDSAYMSTAPGSISKTSPSPTVWGTGSAARADVAINANADLAVTFTCPPSPPSDKYKYLGFAGSAAFHLHRMAPAPWPSRSSLRPSLP